MSAIASVSNFLGANQILHPRLLPEGLGVAAVNMRRGSVDFRPIKAPTTVVSGPMTDFISAWRFGRQVASDTSGWVRWTTDVDVVRSLIATDLNEEVHFTGDGVPKTTDTLLAFPTSAGPAAWQTLGVPAPTAIMGVPTVLVAGSGPPEDRVYIDTYVNNRGRESAPGLPRSVPGVAGGTTMTFPTFSAVPAGQHGITLRRVYVSTDGGDFVLCLEQTATTLSGVDDGTRNTAVILQSGGDESKPAWLPPLDQMTGIISLWNGMLGGFVGKSYMVCEPYKAWAWPVEYREILPDDIIGTARWLQNWVILTTEQPYIVTGSGPLNMGHQPVEFAQACVSKRSVVSVGHGVVWASPNGLCYIGQGGAQVLTEGIFTPEQWQALGPTTMHCAKWERYVVVFYASAGTEHGLMIDPLNVRDGVIFVTPEAIGTFYDPISDRLYLLQTNGVIAKWNAGAVLTARWKSPILRAPVGTNAAVARIIGDHPVSAVFTLWGNNLQPNGTRAWTQVYSATITHSEPFELPSGYEAQEYQFQIESSAPIQGVMIGEDVTEIP
jgi:hypothetical protein